MDGTGIVPGNRPTGNERTTTSPTAPQAPVAGPLELLGGICDEVAQERTHAALRDHQDVSTTWPNAAVPPGHHHLRSEHRDVTDPDAVSEVVEEREVSVTRPRPARHRRRAATLAVGILTLL